MPDNYLDIEQGKRVTELRKKLGYTTLEAFGEYLGKLVDGKAVDKGTISKYEAGVMPIAAKYLVELISTNKLNLLWLRKGTPPMFLSDLLSSGSKGSVKARHKESGKVDLEAEKLYDIIEGAFEQEKNEIINAILARVKKALI